MAWRHYACLRKSKVCRTELDEVTGDAFGEWHFCMVNYAPRGGYLFGRVNEAAYFYDGVSCRVVTCMCHCALLTPYVLCCKVS